MVAHSPQSAHEPPFEYCEPHKVFVYCELNGMMICFSSLFVFLVWLACFNGLSLPCHQSSDRLLWRTALLYFTLAFEVVFSLIPRQH